MATTRFKTTIDAIKGGVKKFTIEKAVQNIEGWEDYLSKHDHEGVKAVVQDLAKLKKLLHAKEIDGEAVKKLVAKMGKDTVKVAGDEQNAEAKHIRELGEALSAAAEKGADTGDEEVATESDEAADDTTPSGKELAKDEDEDEVDDDADEEDDEDTDEDDEDEDEDEDEVDDEDEEDDEDELDDEDEEDDDEDEVDEDDEEEEESDTPKSPAKKAAAKKAPAKKAAPKKSASSPKK